MVRITGDLIGCVRVETQPGMSWLGYRGNVARAETPAPGIIGILQPLLTAHPCYTCSGNQITPCPQHLEILKKYPSVFCIF